MKTSLLVVFILGFAVRADDWPQFLGPERNGSSREKLPPSLQPKTAWKKKIGAGHSGPVVVSNTVVIFHRQGNSELLTAFDLTTGAQQWENKAPTAYRDDFGMDEGPRATPTVSQGRLYAIGAEGSLRCVDFASGREIWSVSARTEFKMRKGFFGFACSPLVAGDNLLLNLGGENGAGIVALDKQTGKLRWKSTDHEASYSSPVTAELAAGERASSRAIFLTREGLVVLNATDGGGRLELPWRARMHASVNAATPLVISNLIFVTASYDTGAALIRVREKKLEKVWSNDESLSSHYATPVHYDGFLYGFHGRQEQGPAFRCVELMTGRVRWSEERFGAGTVTLADDQLLILRESGELVLAPASPKEFKIRCREQILGDDTRAHPALSNRRLLARDKSSLVCVALE